MTMDTALCPQSELQCTSCVFTVPCTEELHPTTAQDCSMNGGGGEEDILLIVFVTSSCVIVTVKNLRCVS